jgi:hypothetical protein
MTVVLVRRVATDRSIVTYDATTEDGRPVVVAVDVRMARAIDDALRDGPTAVVVEDWQIVAH